MIAAYSSDLRERIVRFYHEGQTMREVAETFNVSVGIVHHFVDLHRKYGQVTDQYAQPRRGRKILTCADEDYIHALIEARPSIYLDEIQEKLVTERGVHVSLATVSRTLARMGCSKKSLSSRAAERNEGLRNLWELELAEFATPASLFSSTRVPLTTGPSNVPTDGRLLGVDRCAFFRGKRHSILPALSLDGIMALDIFEGSVNKERFLQFLHEQVVRPSSGLRLLCVDARCRLLS